MKNIFKSSLLLLGALTMFTACSDDNGSNPTLVEPASFVLNTPSYAGETVILKSSKELDFTWNQPNYGFPAAVDYSMQISTTGNFTIPIELAEADESGETVADYVDVEVFDEDRDLNGYVEASAIATGLQKLNDYPEDGFNFEPVDVYCRMVAMTAGADPVYSNAVTIKVLPYYIELKDAPIQIWYITGEFTPDGGWKNNADGSNMLPMLPVPGAPVNAKTGETILEWAGYIAPGQAFKIIAPDGLANWNYGLCGGNEEGGQVYRDGGDDPGNIVYNKGGWVKLTLDAEAKTLTFTEIDEPKAFTQIAMPGSANEWNAASGDLMTIAGMSNAHDWSATITYDADPPADGGVKFAADGSWDVNWGAAAFPIGVGEQGGANIPYKAGTYKVFFNDILGAYYFIAQ